jgi:hypothetical protein
LGEQIGEASGKVTGQRVLNVEGTPKWKPLLRYREIIGELHPKVGTYSAVLEEGVLHGEAQGIVFSKDGQGAASWTGQGVGRFTGPGKVSFRGSLFYRTPSVSEGGKMSFLNYMVGVFEYEVDETGNCSVKVWEWNKVSHQNKQNRRRLNGRRF